MINILEKFLLLLLIRKSFKVIIFLIQNLKMI